MPIRKRSERSEPLIPGLPDEIAEHCFLLLPFPDQIQARSVSSAWNSAISSPSFSQSKESLNLSLPYVFVFSYHESTREILWQAFDPRSRRWFDIPAMPCKEPVRAEGFACAANPRQGALFVLGGLLGGWQPDNDVPMRTLVTYRAATNSWSVGPPMPTARSFFAAACIDGKVIAAGGSGAGAGHGDTLVSVERYDPEEGRWEKAADMKRGLARYDAAVVGRRFYVTEGWSWPFTFSPRGAFYDADRDAWEEMSAGMKEGWTGASAVLDDETLFVASEHGDRRVKVYSADDDKWRYLVGLGLPAQLRKPYVLCGLEGCIYVVGRGLDVAIGRVGRGHRGEWTVDWEFLLGPANLNDYGPTSSQVLYA